MKIPLLIIALFATLLCGTIYAAEEVAAAVSATGNATADSIITYAIPVIVPLILAGVKRVLPKLPSWSLPIIAPVLGVLIDVVNQFATGHSSNLLLAVGLGLAGVGLREVKEAVKPAPNGGWPVAP